MRLLVALLLLFACTPDLEPVARETPCDPTKRGCHLRYAVWPGAPMPELAAAGLPLLAQAEASPAIPDVGADAELVSDLVASGKYLPAASLLLFLLVLGISRNATGWFSTRYGKIVLLVIGTAAWAAFEAFHLGRPLSDALFAAAIAGAGAAAGQAVGKNLLQGNTKAGPGLVDLRPRTPFSLWLLVVMVLPLTGACASAAGMQKVQAQLWRNGGVAHLSASRPPAPGPEASAEEIARFGDWQRALLVAASTLCSEDQSPDACRCADTAALTVIDCDPFLAKR